MAFVDKKFDWEFFQPNTGKDLPKLTVTKSDKDETIQFHVSSEEEGAIMYLSKEDAANLAVGLLEYLLDIEEWSR